MKRNLNNILIYMLLIVATVIGLTSCEVSEVICDELHPDDPMEQYFALSLGAQAVECGPTAEETGFNNIEAQGLMPNLDTFGNKLVYHQFIYIDDLGNQVFTNKCLSQNELPDQTQCFIVDDNEDEYPQIVENSFYAVIKEKNPIEGEDDLFTYILDQEHTAFHTTYVITNIAVNDYDNGTGLELVKCGAFGEIDDVKRLVIDN